MSEKPKPQKPMSKMEEFVRTAHLMEKASCDSDKVTHKGVCALAKAKKFTEIAKLSKFTEELGKKFLSTLGEERFNTKDPYKLLKLLEKERPDWKDIMKRFNKAKSYEVKAAKGDDPAMIVFEYADGKTEKYPLEMSHAANIGIGRVFKAFADKRQGDEDFKKLMDPSINGDIIETLKKISEMPLTEAERKEALRLAAEKEAKKTRELKTLATPQKAYEKLLNTSRYLSDDLLQELSGPLSKLAKLQVDGVGPDDAAFQNTYIELFDVLGKYYPGAEDKGPAAITTKEENNDMYKIFDTFDLI